MARMLSGSTREADKAKRFGNPESLNPHPFTFQEPCGCRFEFTAGKHEHYEAVTRCVPHSQHVLSWKGEE